MVNFGSSEVNPLQRATVSITKAHGGSKAQGESESNKILESNQRTASAVAQKAIKDTDQVTASSLPNIEEKATILNKELDKAAVWLSYTPKAARKGKEKEVANPLSNHRNLTAEAKETKSKSLEMDAWGYEDEGGDPGSQLDPKILAQIYKDRGIEDDHGKPDGYEGDPGQESSENNEIEQAFIEQAIVESLSSESSGVTPEELAQIYENRPDPVITDLKDLPQSARVEYAVSDLLQKTKREQFRDKAIQTAQDLAFRLWRQISRHTSPKTGQTLSRFFVSTKLVKIESMDPLMISKLDPRHMGKVPLDQLKQLDLTELRKMTNRQFLAMGPEKIAQLPTRTAAYIMGRFDNDTRYAMYLTLRDKNPILANQLQAANLTRKPPLIEIDQAVVAGIFVDTNLNKQAVVFNDQKVSTPVTVIVGDTELPVLDQFNLDANRNEFILNGKRVEVGHTVNDVMEELYESTNKDRDLTDKLQVFLNQGPSLTPTVMSEVYNNFTFGSHDPLNVEFKDNRHEYFIISGENPMIEINSSYIVEVKDIRNDNATLGYAVQTLTMNMPLQDFKEGKSERSQTTIDLSPLFFTKTGEGVVATEKNREAAEAYRSAKERKIGGPSKAVDRAVPRKTDADKLNALSKLEREVSQKYDHFDAALLAEARIRNLVLQSKTRSLLRGLINSQQKTISEARDDENVKKDPNAIEMLDRIEKENDKLPNVKELIKGHLEDNHSIQDIREMPEVKNNPLALMVLNKVERGIEGGKESLDTVLDGIGVAEVLDNLYEHINEDAGKTFIPVGKGFYGLFAGDPKSREPNASAWEQDMELVKDVVIDSLEVHFREQPPQPISLEQKKELKKLVEARLSALEEQSLQTVKETNQILETEEAKQKIETFKKSFKEAIIEAFKQQKVTIDSKKLEALKKELITGGEEERAIFEYAIHGVADSGELLKFAAAATFAESPSKLRDDPKPISKVAEKTEIIEKYVQNAWEFALATNYDVPISFPKKAKEYAELFIDQLPTKN